MPWRPDILGAGFEQCDLPIRQTGDDELVGTLVRARPNPWAARFGQLAGVDVLSIHGWSDYFFQPAQARFYTARGARFYALDLRRYGRSLRPGQTPGYIDDLADYDVEIDQALRIMGHGVDAAGRRRLVLMGHSTGGLVLTLWAARHHGRAAALVLNSPWLELQTGALVRSAIAPLTEVRARFDPHGAQPALDFGYYSRAQREIGGPPYDSRWRPERAFRTHPGWLAAILSGHRQVAAGVDVGCPVLVLLSARSVSPLRWSEEMTRADAVLTVDEIARAATKIGPVMTLARIDGAIHDVFLSRAPAAASAYGTVAAWLPAVLRAPH